MSVQGFYNHYDDPDEFWDEEPLQPLDRSPRDSGSAAISPTPVAAPTPASNPTPKPPRDAMSPGSSFVTMHLDNGLLPVRVELSRQWSRYVEPQDSGLELMRAYQNAIAQRIAERCATSRTIPTLQSISDGAVPPRRTMLMVLLETDSWEQYQATTSALVGRAEYRAHSNAMIYGEPAVVITADRVRLASITVRQDWAQRVMPEDIADEILWCAEQIRSLRPNLRVSKDYSRYSDEDLEFNLARHSQRLFEDRII